MEQASRTIVSHYQAFVCMSMHFCNESSEIHDWIDNHSFGNNYPNHYLPIETCKHPQASLEQQNLLCQACEQVIDVVIDRGECLPQFKTLQPGSLQERVDIFIIFFLCFSILFSLFIYLFICLFVCLFIYLFVCLLLYYY